MNITLLSDQVSIKASLDAKILSISDFGKSYV